MGKKISALPAATILMPSDELGENQTGTSKKNTLANLLHDTTFNEEEHLMCMAYNNPHKFITIFDDFNGVPYWEALPPFGLGYHRGLHSLAPGSVGENVYLPLVGLSSVNSSMSIEGGIMLMPSDQLGLATAWVWRIEDKHEFVLACGFTWASTGTYKVGGGPSNVPGANNITNPEVGPRFESIGGETMKFRWGTSVDPYEIDTGILGTGVAGGIQGAEQSMHTFLAHHKDRVLRVFADGVLVGTQSNKIGGHANDQGWQISASGALNIDYFMLSVQREGQLL